MNNLFHHPALSNILAKATFPPDNQLAHVVNGERNKLLLSLANTGKENFTLLNAAASYHDPAQHWALELGLTIWANLRDDATGGVHRVVAYNETVTVVEPMASLFDLKALVMYLILAATIAGLSYLAYETLSARYFPKPPTTSRASKKSTSSSSTVQGSSDKVLVATDGKGQGGYPASVQPYEEEWIPEHLTRKTGGGAATRRKTTGAGVAVGAGEVTSGGEGEKGRAVKGKGKGRK
ncbi:hypothetical protein QFC21_000070 [Naganishia friedmannii]|uniref:Uncharacterized protein n=1 Tax=Naganishia friedmannii TaxID=89922 RepID=A0ACC2WC96_9TREE|nr:hypothetical protein QFC21_000070 [Naganishia friedmannii]